MGAGTIFLTDRLREMISKYAKNPDRFFSNGQPDEAELDRLINKYIAIEEGVRFGQACIKGTRIAVRDILGCTCSLKTPKTYVLQKAFTPPIPEESIDAAFAFLMKFPEKAEQDFKDNDFYGREGLPQELYS